MSIKDNIFSSKPKQIAQAASQVLLKVFGKLSSVRLIVISDMMLTTNIAQNFKNSGLKQYEVFEESLDILLENKFDIKEIFLDQFKNFDMIMIGYKSQAKIINKDFVKKLLNKRKQKPIFFVDCGIPGNINIDVAKISNCYLFDLNDLEQLYSSWVQINSSNDNTIKELYDIELRIILDSFFKKMNLDIEQKMIFEKRINFLLKTKGREIKSILKIFLKTF